MNPLKKIWLRYKLRIQRRRIQWINRQWREASQKMVEAIQSLQAALEEVCHHGQSEEHLQ